MRDDRWLYLQAIRFREEERKKGVILCNSRGENAGVARKGERGWGGGGGGQAVRVREGELPHLCCYQFTNDSSSWISNNP